MSISDDQILERLRTICREMADEDVPLTSELKLIDLFAYRGLHTEHKLWDFIWAVEWQFDLCLPIENWIDFLGEWKGGARGKTVSPFTDRQEIGRFYPFKWAENLRS